MTHPLLIPAVSRMALYCFHPHGGRTSPDAITNDLPSPSPEYAVTATVTGSADMLKTARFERSVGFDRSP